MATSQDFVNWVCGPDLDHEFLKYLLMAEGDDLLRFSSGAVHQTIYFPEVKAFHICLPELSEQRRIVAILNEGTKALASAKADTTKNVDNARSLFESYLQTLFEKQGHGWATKPIPALATHSLGKMLDKAKNKGDRKPYLRNINVRWFAFDLSSLLEMPFLPNEADKYTAIRGDVLVCEGGYPGRAAIWNESRPIYFQKALHRVRFHEPTHARWFVYYLYAQDKSGDLKRHFSGAGIQHFTGEALARFQIPIPPLPEMRRKIATIEALSKETERLIETYQAKLSALEELERTLLHRAFSGELGQAGAKSPVVRFATKLSAIPTTDLHAGILALAYGAHEAAGKPKSFGHVKAEKIAHMVEALVGIDLGRKPVKDAAGPNDYAHLLKVEHRARKAGYFAFTRVNTGGYRVTKLRQFNALVQRVREALATHCEAVEKLIALMLQMTTQQAEIFATVYAAWNNLLLDGKSPTDEEIVFEARENWHPDKLKIPREKFFTAIKWLREKNVVPTGSGKRVVAKTAA